MLNTCFSLNSASQDKMTNSLEAGKDDGEADAAVEAVKEPCGPCEQLKGRRAKEGTSG